MTSTLHQVRSFRDRSIWLAETFRELSSEPLQRAWVAAWERERTGVLWELPVGDLPQAQELLDRLTSAAPAVRAGLAAPLAGSVEGSRLLLLWEFIEGSSLQHLLGVVPLSSQQATWIGERVLAIMAGLQAAGLRHGEITAPKLLIDHGGGLRLTSPFLPMASTPGVPAPTGDQAQSAEVLRGLLAAVPDNSWRRAPAGTKEQLEQICVALQGDGSTAPVTAALALSRWRRAAGFLGGRPGRVTIQAELAALQSRLPDEQTSPREAAPTPGSTIAADPVPAPPPDLRPTAPEASWAPPPKTLTSRRNQLAVGALLVLLLASGAALIGFQGNAHQGHGRPTPTPRFSPRPPAPKASPTPQATASSPTAPASAPITPALATIPDLGPASAGPIESLQLSPGCQLTSGPACSYTLRAALGPHPAVQLAWAMEMVDRCDGAVTSLASGTVAAPSNYAFAFAQSEVRIPPDLPLALIGVITGPVLAASLPVLIDSSGSCPR